MTDPAVHRGAVEAWRAQRYAALRRDTGWLTLAGLSWLEPGVNRVGRDPASDVVLPGGPAAAGIITVVGGETLASGEFMHEGEAIHELRLVNDQQGEPTLLELGSLRLCVISRAGRLAVRTWDLGSWMRRDFDGIDHWPVDARWCFEGRFEPTPDRTLPVPDVLGTREEQPSPGDVTFDLDGVTHRLQALRGGDAGELWLVFGDETNRHETYGGGRFVYTGPPDRHASVVVDFNRAYNPPCVFSPYATCPLPWPANRLPFRVEAGERAWAAPH